MAGVEKQVFLEWVRAHHGVLYRHALWMIGDRDVAADVVQETFYRAWKGRAKLRDRDNPVPWLLAILRRATYQEINHSQRVLPLADADMLEAGPGEGMPEDMIDLTRALRGLSPAHRELLLLYVLHGLTYADIGRVLEVPMGTVMSRLARARRALQRALEATDSDNVVPLKKAKS